ncbi:hypothetical protein FACS1894187_11140 [Synergistales bacterium]|nr:hypothetical protein FACS1894187_11140 [Synergistales bacterium]
MMAESKNAPSWAINDWAILKKWVGAEEGQPLTEEQHEQIADGFLNYINEGKAPAPELSSVFKRFGDWLKYLIEQGEINKIEMSEAVKNVYSRFLVRDANKSALTPAEPIVRNSVPESVQTKNPKGEITMDHTKELQQIAEKLEEDLKTKEKETPNVSLSHLVQELLEETNSKLNGYGVKSTQIDIHYINMGDPQDLTILFDTREDKFFVSTLSDVLKEKEREYGEFQEKNNNSSPSVQPDDNWNTNIKKYTLTDKQNKDGLYRIKALIDIPVWDVIAGDPGGFVASEDNLSHRGKCWIKDNAQVKDDAIVTANALIGEEAILSDNARADGNSQVWGKAKIRDHGYVSRNALVYDSATICNYGCASDNAQVHGEAKIRDHSAVFEKSEMDGNAEISGGSYICGKVKAKDQVKIKDASIVSGNIELGGDTEISGRSILNGSGKIYNKTIHNVKEINKFFKDAPHKPTPDIGR